MSKLRVVLVTDSLYYGGSERLLVDIAKRIDRNVFDVKVCAITAGGELLEKELEGAGIEYRVLNKGVGPSINILLTLRSLFCQWRPHIIHTFRFTANTYGRVSAVLARIPVIISTEHVFEHKPLVYRLIDLILAQFTDRTVVVTEEIREQVHAQQRMPYARIQLIEEGIDLEWFVPVSPLPFSQINVASDRPFKVGVVARLVPQKGHLIFLEAIKRARHIHPEIKGIIVGTGELRSDLERWVEINQMQESIEFWGFREDLSNVFRKLDLFAISSSWEGLPLALLDAAASGMPFVCTAVGGIQDTFKDGVHGRLVPPDDPGEFADAIIWSLENYNSACSLAVRASDLVHRRFGICAMIKQHEQLYQQLARNTETEHGVRTNGKS